MTRAKETIRRLLADSAGAATVEWALLLACFVLPMIWVLRQLLDVLGERYGMVSFLESLPFP